MGASSKTLTFSGGRCILTPTNLALPASDCGGTQLGTVVDVNVTFIQKVDPITAEEWGSTMVDGVYLDTEIIVEVLGTNWDADFVQAAIYGGANTSGRPTLTFPHTNGELASTSGVLLLWLPNDEAAAPAVLIYNALPWEIAKPIHTNAQRPAVVRSTFYAARDSNNNTLAIDTLTNLSLT